jgi:hypothetical protein
LLYGACYRGYCPDKKLGLYLMLFATIFIFVASLLPEGKDKK